MPTQESRLAFGGGHGCCWETSYIFASCGLVVELQIHLSAELLLLLIPFQRRAREPPPHIGLLGMSELSANTKSVTFRGGRNPESHHERVMVETTTLCIFLGLESETAWIASCDRFFPMTTRIKGRSWSSFFLEAAVCVCTFSSTSELRSHGSLGRYQINGAE